MKLGVRTALCSLSVIPQVCSHLSLTDACLFVQRVRDTRASSYHVLGLLRPFLLHQRPQLCFKTSSSTSFRPSLLPIYCPFILKHTIVHSLHDLKTVRTTCLHRPDTLIRGTRKALVGLRPLKYPTSCVITTEVEAVRTPQAILLRQSAALLRLPSICLFRTLAMQAAVTRRSLRLQRLRQSQSSAQRLQVTKRLRRRPSQLPSLWSRRVRGTT